MNVPPIVNASTVLAILTAGLVAGLAAASTAATAPAGVFSVLIVLAGATLLAASVDSHLGDSDTAVHRRAIALGLVTS